MTIQAIIPYGWTALQADIDSGAADSLTGGSILIVDASGQATGKVYEAGPAGQSPSEVATSSTVASAVAKILVKDWAASTAVDADEVRRTPVAAGTIEAGDLIRSNSARTTGATFDATEAGFWTEISPDIVTSVAGRTGAVVLTELTDGSVQALFDTVRADAVTMLPSATDLNTLTGTGWYNIQNATNGPAGGGWYYYFHGVHRSTATGTPATNYGFQFAKRLDLAGTNNLLMRVNTNNSWSAWVTLATTDAATTTVAGLMAAADKAKLDGIATGAEVNVQSDWTATTGDALILNKPTIPDAVTINNTLTSTSTTEALSAAQGKALQDGKASATHSHAQSEVTGLTTALDGKQETLSSGNNVKTVNGSSILGSGNITIAGDLPGGAATTAYDDGLGSGNAAIDRTTVTGQTILKYETAGASTFKVPDGVTEAQVLVVAGGGGGGSGVGGDLRGGGGGPVAANGGAGGGGRGGAYPAGAATAGSANTGGGGGGGANTVAGAAGGSGLIVVRFSTQSRSYQALTSYADNAAALAGGLLVGQFFKLTSTGAVQQVA